MKKDDILGLKKRWSSIKKRYVSDAFMQIPIPVIYTQASKDAEYVTDELSHFLYDEKILNWSNPSHKRYLILPIKYVPQDENPSWIFQDLMNNVQKASKSSGFFRGIILIDISEWQGHFHENNFKSILSYLSNLRVNGLVPFFFTNIKTYNPEARTLEAAVSSYFRSARVVLEVIDYHTLMISEITKKGISVDKRTSFYLELYINRASESGSFHGTDSVLKICDEIICRYNPIQNSYVVLDVSVLKELFND